MALNKSYLTRNGIRLGWALGENMYRGDNEREPGLLHDLRILTLANTTDVTDFAKPDPSRHFPPNYDINNWLENDKTYPPPYQAVLRKTSGGQIIDLLQTVEPPVPFPPPGGTPDPQYFTTGYEEGKWTYDFDKWVVIGLVSSIQTALKGRLIFSKVDNSFVFWDGAQWRTFARLPERSLDISMHFPKSLIGGRLFAYCAVEEFHIPANFIGSTGSGSAKGNVTLQVARNNDAIGTVTIPADPNSRAFFSGGNIAFSPGDRLSVYADGNTNGLKDVSVTIRGIYT